MYKTSGKIAQRRPRRFRLWGSGQGDDGVSPEPLPKHGRAVGSASSVAVLPLAGSTKYSSSSALSPRTASGSATSFVHQDILDDDVERRFGIRVDGDRPVLAEIDSRAGDAMR